MNRRRDYYTKWIKSDSERQISYYSYVECNKNDTNELIYKAERESQT